MRVIKRADRGHGDRPALAPFAAAGSAGALLSPVALAACVGVGLSSSVIPYALG